MRDFPHIGVDDTKRARGNSSLQFISQAIVVVAVNVPKGPQLIHLQSRGGFAVKLARLVVRVASPGIWIPQDSDVPTSYNSRVIQQWKGPLNTECRFLNLAGTHLSENLQGLIEIYVLRTVKDHSEKLVLWEIKFIFVLIRKCS